MKFLIFNAIINFVVIMVAFFACAILFAAIGGTSMSAAVAAVAVSSFLIAYMNRKK